MVESVARQTQHPSCLPNYHPRLLPVLSTRFTKWVNLTTLSCAIVLMVRQVIGSIADQKQQPLDSGDAPIGP